MARHTARVVRGALDVALLVVAAAVVVRLLGAESAHPWVALMSGFAYLAPLTAVGVAAAAALRHRRATLGFVLVHVVVLGVLAPQVVPGPHPADAPDGPTITVMGANLLHGCADTDALVGIVDRYGVDILVVAELSRSAVRRLDEAELGIRLPHLVTADVDTRPHTGVYSRFRLHPGPAITADPHYAMATVGMVVPGAPPLQVVAVHPRPPVGDLGVRMWRRALAALPSADVDALRLLVGDFNATPDHAEFRAVLDRGYVGAGDVTGRGLVPTRAKLLGWPPVPPVPIDHVVVDRRVDVLGLDVVPLPGSDHDAVVARLRLPSRG